MRIYSNSFELMSEMGRELNSYGQTVKPKTYQNKVIETQYGYSYSLIQRNGQMPSLKKELVGMI